MHWFKLKALARRLGQGTEKGECSLCELELSPLRSRARASCFCRASSSADAIGDLIASSFQRAGTATGARAQRALASGSYRARSLRDRTLPLRRHRRRHRQAVPQRGGGWNRRGHKTPFGRLYWEDETYSDQRVLLHIPKGFDLKKPSVMIVYFHGHGATLRRDVLRRQRVPAQITASGVNAVLVAPQLAVDAADSSAGKFWEPGAFGRFVGEAAQKLAKLARRSALGTHLRQHADRHRRLQRAAICRPPGAPPRAAS